MESQQTQHNDKPSQLTVDEAFNQALEYFYAQKYNETDKLCTAIIQSEPKHVDAINLLGVVAQKVNRHELAIEFFKKAIKIDGNIALLYYNLGTSLYPLGRSQEAIQALNTALRKDPENSQVINYLNNITNNQISDIDVNNSEKIAEDFLQKGITCHQADQIEKAIYYYKKALKKNPGLASAFSNIGVALQHQGKLKEAVYSYEKALKIDPYLMETHNNLGNILAELGKLDKSIECFNKAISINPSYVSAYNNLGKVMQEQNRLEEALTLYQKAIEIKPDFAQAYYNVGSILDITNKQDEAIASYDKAIELNPNLSEAYNNIGAIFFKLGELEKAVSKFKEAILIKPDYVNAHSNLIFSLDFICNANSDIPHMQRELWAKQHTEHLLPFWKNLKNSQEPERILRIGYVAAEFWRHPNAEIFGPVLLNHDSSKYQIFCYVGNTHEDDLTSQFKQKATKWIKTDKIDDATLAEKICQDKIDILVDLNGHSPKNRLMAFARKPAPIQINAWGYPLGTKMAAMDYLFSDPISHPKTERHKYTEHIVDLTCVIHMNSDTVYPQITDPPFFKNGYITFGAFNRLEKYTKKIFKLWAKILHRVPGSKLLMKTERLDSLKQQKNIHDIFEKEGISTKRITLLGKTSKTEHLLANSKVDIMLDPFPHNGGITTIVSLRMGVPVLTYEKDTPFKVSAAILHVLGLDDWRAKSEADYVNLAIKFAKNKQTLKNLRYQLRDKVDQSALGDSKLYTKEVESIYRKLWYKWCKSL
ncbi:MAG: tetratricopeptide repeat protein [Magnetococcales bacterium]|nr:tetratricopeptide repeat protein [Magnetococcales bacterium]